MSSTSDLINLARDVLETITELSMPIRKQFNKVGDEGTERFVINSIPNNQTRAGVLKQNTAVLNVNFYVPKIDGLTDSLRIETIDDLVQNAFESYSIESTRVGYYYLNPQPMAVFNESDKENLINIRVETTYT